MAKQAHKIAIVLVLIILIALPVSASAETKAGIKPGSFFYFFDTTFEKVDLFFTFSPEKKVQKALGYASERLAEIEDVAEEKDSDAIKTALTNYESNVALATEKSKEIKDKGQVENLLNLITDNTSKNQEVLTAVLAKVPEEAKEAITRAIEASRKGQEEATKQITELKKEVSELKKKLEDLEKELKDKEEGSKNNDDKKDDQAKAINTLKNEIENLKKETNNQFKQETKNNIVNLPNGAIVEMDKNGNVVKIIKEEDSLKENTNIPILQQIQQSIQQIAQNTTPVEPPEIVPVDLLVGLDWNGYGNYDSVKNFWLESNNPNTIIVNRGGGNCESIYFGIGILYSDDTIKKEPIFVETSYVSQGGEIKSNEGNPVIIWVYYPQTQNETEIIIFKYKNFSKKVIINTKDSMWKEFLELPIEEQEVKAKQGGFTWPLENIDQFGRCLPLRN